MSWFCIFVVNCKLSMVNYYYPLIFLGCIKFVEYNPDWSDQVETNGLINFFRLDLSLRVCKIDNNNRTLLKWASIIGNITNLISFVNEN